MTRTIRREKAQQVLALLEQTYPKAHCALNYETPLQLLVATILSAQCTDVRVNMVTPVLFGQFPDAGALAEASVEEVEKIIRSTGFYRNKAKNIVACAAVLRSEYGGEPPRTLDELVRLPGVGRKTANVVLGNVFETPAMVVDTHVKRISRRLGWTREVDPVKIEQDLCRLLPESSWTQAGHTLIFHGRQICKAPVPTCSLCPVAHLCPRKGVKKSR